MRVATRNDVSTLEDYLFLFFTPSAASQDAGRAFWNRRHQRTQDDLVRCLPWAQLVLYPDAGHGSIFQYPQLFVSQATRFLDAEPARSWPFVSLRGTHTRR
jgi:pimeloyl-ACP methyl ester carboxylesterase